MCNHRLLPVSWPDQWAELPLVGFICHQVKLGLMSKNLQTEAWREGLTPLGFFFCVAASKMGGGRKLGRGGAPNLFSETGQVARTDTT